MHRDTEGFHYMTLRKPGVSTALDKAGCFLQARSERRVCKLRKLSILKNSTLSAKMF